MTLYDKLKAEVLRLRHEGKLRPLSSEERADWAYGTTVMENSTITRDMATSAAKASTKKPAA